LEREIPESGNTSDRELATILVGNQTGRSDR
jgi:hypothetical protein